MYELRRNTRAFAGHKQSICLKHPKNRKQNTPFRLHLPQQKIISNDTVSKSKHYGYEVKVAHLRIVTGPVTGRKWHS